MNFKHAVAVMALASVSAPGMAQTIFHYDVGSTGTTDRVANNSILTLLTVTSNQTINGFGQYIDLASNGNLTFRIYDNANGNVLYTSAAKAFTDDGFSYKYSDPFSFTFNPGVTYGVGATANVAATYRYDFTANTVGAFTFRQNNGNVANGVYQGNGGVDVDTALVVAVPEPATWGLMIVGFGAVGGTLRRRKRTGQTPAFA